MPKPFRIRQLVPKINCTLTAYAAVMKEHRIMSNVVDKEDGLHEDLMCYSVHRYPLSSQQFKEHDTPFQNQQDLNVWPENGRSQE
jgi:hypothetical protein